MQGFADEDQKTTGVESRLFSRAFIVADLEGAVSVVIVSADIWAGTSVVKEEVVKRLQEKFGALYRSDNVLISGTHTHSAPGGYTGYYLYDLTGGGFNQHTYECIVSGMVASIQKAHNNLAPGNIYLTKGDIPECGRNRSPAAYLNNPQSERDRYPNRDTDNEMLLLRFMKLDPSGKERPVGVISWYGIHPTDRGQKNTLVCGDNKGYASHLLETSMQYHSVPDTFVAAFANAIAGDVSGNLEFGHIPNGTDDKKNMEKHGTQQYEKAKQLLYDAAAEALSGSIDCRHRSVDMSCVEIENTYLVYKDHREVARTWPAALGLSFAAGSREDGVPNPDVLLREGITTSEANVNEKIANVLISLAAQIGKLIPSALDFPPDIVRGHVPKPILFAPGARDGLVPKILPIQILKIGQLVIVGFPGELTTMAGRRLRNDVLDALRGTGVQHLAMAAYANDYSQYVTTKEEYDMQHYEGASNLFGPFTLQAYQQEFRKLALTLRIGETGGIAAVSWDANRLDIFGIGLDKGMCHKAWDGSAWTGWEVQGGAFTSPLTAVSWDANRLDIFGIGLNNAMYHKAWDGSAWTNWESLGGDENSGFAFSSRPAAVSRSANRLDIFGIGLDKAMRHKAWDGSGWTNWESLGGAFISPPAAVSRGGNRLDIFGIGLGNAMHHKAWDGSAWRTDWNYLGGALSGPPAAVSWNASRLDIFCIGLDKAMYHKWWDGIGGSFWRPSLTDWENLYGAFSSPTAAVSRGTNRLDIFCIGLDKAMYHKWWDGSAWRPSLTDWDNLGGAFPFTSPPAAVSGGANRLDIFALGLDKAMYHKWWDGRAWLPSKTDWEPLGGVFASGLTTVQDVTKAIQQAAQRAVEPFKNGFRWPG